MGGRSGGKVRVVTPVVRSSTDLADLVAELLAAAHSRQVRFILGIAGPPGAGKSTLAERIVDAAAGEAPACVAPLDGFHRSNEDLTAAGLLALKGTPATFDAAAFVDRLTAVVTMASEPVTWPTYDREREEVVPNGLIIAPEHRLVVVEGNYLLLTDPPWDQVRPLLDAAWYVDVPLDTLVPRLIARHRLHRDAAGAAAKVASTDVPNAELVAASKRYADVVLVA